MYQPNRIHNNVKSTKHIMNSYNMATNYYYEVPTTDAKHNIGNTSIRGQYACVIQV